MSKSNPFKEFIANLEEEALSVATRNAYQYDLNKFEQWVMESKGDSIDLT